MSRPSRHLTFANLASATALVVALGGGGAAVASGLAKNSVGSPQVRDGAITSADLRDDGVTGRDVKESTLAAVRRAASAGAVDTVRTVRAQASAGQGAVVATVGSLVVELACTNNGGSYLSSALTVRSTADHAVLSSGGDTDGDVGPEDGAREVNRITAGSQDAAPIYFTAVSATGRLVTGTGFVRVHVGGQPACSAVLTVVG